MFLEWWRFCIGVVEDSVCLSTYLLLSLCALCSSCTSRLDTRFRLLAILHLELDSYLPRSVITDVCL